MIVWDVEVYSPTKEGYVFIEAIVDTGASLCVIPEHIAQELGIVLYEEAIHLWQVRDPLVLVGTALRIRYNGALYEVRATVVEIPGEYQRGIRSEEKCKRPSSPHPLTRRMILGENFLNQLPEKVREQILLSKAEGVRGTTFLIFSGAFILYALEFLEKRGPDI